jgi:hypothetical protein
MQQQEEELTLWERCKEEIYARTWWLGPEQQDVRPLQVPIKLRDPVTKKDEPLPLPQPCLSEAKPGFAPDCLVEESLPIALSKPSVRLDLPKIMHDAENPQPYPQAIVEMPVGVQLCEPHSYKDL